MLTDSNGLYEFVDLPAETYYVLFTDQVGFIFTLRNQSADDSIDSDVMGYGFMWWVLLPPNLKQHGMVSAPNDFAYGVGKSGVVYMTRQIAADYATDGIICNAVAPGKILTGKGGDAMTPEALAYSRARTPMPRLGRPEDVANAALFLASDEATYITGENLMVDGGWRAA